MNSISVIIPTYNSLVIPDILTALKQQTIKEVLAEILVIGIDEPGLVIEDRLIKFIDTNHNAYGAHNRNIGIDEAIGDVLLFIDHDCLPASDLVEWHLHQHQNEELIVGGAVTFGKRNYLQLADNVSAYHDLLPSIPAGPKPYLSTANLSVNRDVITKAGKMPEHMTRAEDLDWTVRIRSLGYRLYFEPNALVYHDPPRRSLPIVWKHWSNDAHDTLSVRLRYSKLLQTPSLAKYRWVYLLGAPLIATWATARTFAHPQVFSQYWYTFPLIYLTKVAWCWGLNISLLHRGIHDTIERNRYRN